MKGRVTADSNPHSGGTKRGNQHISANKRQRMDLHLVGRRDTSHPHEQQPSELTAGRFDLASNVVSGTRQQDRPSISRLTSSNQMARDLPHVFLNAPTSLANLAQLSGISLVPVAANRNQDSNQDGVGCNQRQQTKISGNSTVQPRSQVTTHNVGKKNTVSNAISVGSNQQRSTYNIAAIPSIQLLNQQVSDDSRNAGSTNDRFQSFKPDSSKNSRHRAGKTSNSSNRLHKSSLITTAAATFNGNNLNLPSSIDLFPELAASSLDHAQPSDGIEMPTESRPTMSFGQLCQDDNEEQESNDLSLMRLMAVLNNPALSLTPVDSIPLDKYVGNNEGCDRLSSMDPRIQDESKSSQVGNDPQFTSGGSNVALRTHGPPDTSNTKRANRNAARLPKSTTNLIDAGLIIKSTNEDLPEASSKALMDANQAFSQSLDTEKSPEWLPSGATSQFTGHENSVTLSWLPSRVTQIDDYANTERARSESNSALAQTGPTSQTISVQMLHQFANQNNNMECQDSNDSMISPCYEPECSPTTSRVNVQQLDKGARRQEVLYTVYNSDMDTISESDDEPHQGSKDRLFIPRPVRVSPAKVHKLPTIHIETTQQKEVLVSERHFMLEKMVEIAETVGQKKHAPVDPDDIFVNRPKRIMSRIDTILEKKRRRRFERICHRTSPKNTDGDDFLDVSDDDSIYEENTGLVEAIVVPIQLPLEETLTDEKREYLSHVGLISRTDRNLLSLQHCENRLKSISSIALEETGVVSDDLTRFVDTIIKTGGTDIQLRTETNIKRNELPFVEGLNRNTSRVKMNYMSVLGLDKRSKRTTLYKVTKPQEKKSVKTSAQKQPTDLTNKQEKGPVDNLASISQSLAQHILQPNVRNGNNPIRIEADLLARVLKLSNSSCREELQLPKDEYMRSLGLMAS